jgi:hypothetical protein
VLELRDGTRKNDKQPFTHIDLHKTKQQVGYCIAGTLLVLGRITSRLEFTRLTTIQTWGKPSLPPYSILCACPQNRHPNVILSHDSQVGIPTTRILIALEADNFACKPLIEMRFQTKV